MSAQSCSNSECNLKKLNDIKRDNHSVTFYPGNWTVLFNFWRSEEESNQDMKKIHERAANQYSVFVTAREWQEFKDTH